MIAWLLFLLNCILLDFCYHKHLFLYLFRVLKFKCSSMYMTTWYICDYYSVSRCQTWLSFMLYYKTQKIYSVKGIESSTLLRKKKSELLKLKCFNNYQKIYRSGVVRIIEFILSFFLVLLLAGKTLNLVIYFGRDVIFIFVHKIDSLVLCCRS